MRDDEHSENLSNRLVKMARQPSAHSADLGYERRPKPKPCPWVRVAWSDERVDLVKKLWASGLSARQIAIRLGGTSRNAVIGKIHRLGLADGRPAKASGSTLSKSQRALHAKRRRSAAAPAFARGMSPLQKIYMGDVEPYVPPVDEVVIPLHERKTVQTIGEHDCRWPIGDPQHADFHFCGKNKVPGLPYCEIHARRAFQPPPPRRSNSISAGGASHGTGMIDNVNEFQSAN